MATTIQSARQAIGIHLQEIHDVLRVEPIDHLAIEEHSVAIMLECKRIRSATNLCSAAPHAMQQFMDRHFPVIAHI